MCCRLRLSRETGGLSLSTSNRFSNVSTTITFRSSNSIRATRTIISKTTRPFTTDGQPLLARRLIDEPHRKRGGDNTRRTDLTAFNEPDSGPKESDVRLEPKQVRRPRMGSDNFSEIFSPPSVPYGVSVHRWSKSIGRHVMLATVPKVRSNTTCATVRVSSASRP